MRPTKQQVEKLAKLLYEESPDDIVLIKWGWDKVMESYRESWRSLARAAIRHIKKGERKK